MRETTALLLVAAFLAPAAAQPPAAAQALAESRRALDEGRLEEALIHASEAVTADPGRAEPFLQRARVRRALIRQAAPSGAGPEAVDASALVADLDEAVRLAPKSADAAFLRAEVRRFELQDSTGALQDYDRALKLDPGRADALIGRSEALRTLGRYPEALDAADRARRKDPVIAWLQRARVLAETEDYTGAAEAVREAAKEGRPGAGLPEGTFEFLRAAGQAADARRELVEAHAQAGTATAADVDRARREALAAHSMAVALFPDAAAGYVGRAGVYRALGDAAAEAREVALAVERAPADPESWMARARLAEREGRGEDARAAWIKAAELQISRRLETTEKTEKTEKTETTDTP